MNNNWYTPSKGNSLQGIVIDEATGRTVAVTYDPKDAPLVAAAPKMFRALRFLADAAGTEPGMAIYRDHIRVAWGILHEIASCCHCGRDNSEHGNVCTSDDCPGAEEE